MAEAALVQPPAKTPRRENDAVRLAQQIRQAAPKTRTPPTSSISQELVAAAEIIQWEKEHEVFPDVPAPVAILSSKLHNFNCCLCKSLMMSSTRETPKRYIFKEIVQYLHKT
ncbi:uncharacterized protein PITG_11156 [Phytophthora infestans T30-4]|uniref:Uncharacterized protein n=1 Tax=Phytophthora infestans (strain T30-4) TaxID=403677 RepID=D0NGB3_PHYIT|nr:uncharacterized protein PITG_11156 [Phytophthora infestans T30-4]EEY57314.1 hypothetical protein PITG_11156 [Phytophthora infestans T30-4]|eukprot:XP_002901924.1 hypothetical protein PITG_11156 [Phytophthora infestans T30-4]